MYYLSVETCFNDHQGWKSLYAGDDLPQMKERSLEYFNNIVKQYPNSKNIVEIFSISDDYEYGYGAVLRGEHQEKMMRIMIWSTPIKEKTKDPLTFKALREANLNRNETKWLTVDSWSCTDWACAVTDKISQVCHIIKDLRCCKTCPAELKAALAQELAETGIYLDILAARADIDLEKAIREKFNHVSDVTESAVYL